MVRRRPHLAADPGGGHGHAGPRPPSGQPWLPVERSWRLNERHYGALQGLDKKATTELHGPEQTKLWRRSYDVPPPPVGLGTTRSTRPRIARYRRLPPDVLPATECLKDVVARVLPYWHDAVVPQLRAGLVPLVVAHGNSLRALVKHLEHISDADIAELEHPDRCAPPLRPRRRPRRRRRPATWVMPTPSPRPRPQSRSKRARDHGESCPDRNARHGRPIRPSHPALDGGSSLTSSATPDLSSRPEPRHP